MSIAQERAPSAALRLAQVGDGPALASIYAPSVSRTSISFEVTAPTPEEMELRLATVLAYAPWLVCELRGKIAGFAYVSRHRERPAYQWSLDSAVYVAADHQRKGVARALYTTLFALARLQGYYAIHAGVTLPNPASVGLHEALGFEPVGVYRAVGYKLGGWHDVGWWQLELRERRGDPALPISSEAARAEHARDWAAAFDAGQRLLSS